MGELLKFPTRPQDLNRLSEEIVMQAEHIYASSLHLLLNVMELQLSIMGVSRNSVSNEKGDIR